MDNFLELVSSLPAAVTDRYSVKREIGTGGMGNVYCATDLQLKRNVAIKTIRPEFRENIEVNKRIERECRFHAAIGVHPNIVGLYDKLVVEDQVFLILEYVEGKTLTELIASANQNRGELSPTIVVEIVTQLLGALSTIHENGILHRDIKPSNILIGGLGSDSPFAKLMDFGIARERVEDEHATKLTQLDISNPGTPAYMSPERIDSAAYGEISTATDLYAVGVILYELFNLEPPFKGTMTEIFSGHLAREPDFSNISVVPEPIRIVLQKALEKETTNRYQDAKLFAKDLRAASLTVGDETILANTYDPSTLNETVLNANYTPPNRRLSKPPKPYLVAAATVVLLVVVGVVGVYYISTTQNEDITASSVVDEVVGEKVPENVVKDGPSSEMLSEPKSVASSGGKEHEDARIAEEEISKASNQEKQKGLVEAPPLNDKDSTTLISKTYPDDPEKDAEEVQQSVQLESTAMDAHERAVAQKPLPTQTIPFRENNPLTVTSSPGPSSFKKSNAAFAAYEQALAEKTVGSSKEVSKDVGVGLDTQMNSMNSRVPLILAREKRKKVFSIPVAKPESQKPQQKTRRRADNPIIIIPTT